LNYHFNFDGVQYKAGTNFKVIPKEQIWLQFNQQQTKYIKKHDLECMCCGRIFILNLPVFTY
jgi:hypothetical protein